MAHPPITRDAVQRFYDRLGSRMDWGDPFSRAKLRALELLQLAPGERVLNVGAGTGRDQLRLQRAAGAEGIAVGVDISPVMLRLAHARGALVTRADAHQLPFHDESFDRLWCTYVLDLMPDDDLPSVLGEFRRVLNRGGRMALVSMTEGTTPASRIVVGTWKLLYRAAPKATGGCRPLALADLVAPAGLRVVAREIIVQYAFPSEVVAAVRE
jgi:demethylmenaquinone methyltransferase / 2-methoxy-6-polyprenyl-1,4-benzoquinol methylase